jgi:hypothetical protein
MTPKNSKTVTLADDVFERPKRGPLAEAPDARGRTYSREMVDATTDDEAIQIAVDAVHEHRTPR